MFLLRLVEPHRLIYSADLNFADSDSISSWAKDAVAAAYELDIISGYPDNSFKPNKTATRAEALAGYPSPIGSRRQAPLK